MECAEKEADQGGVYCNALAVYNRCANAGILFLSRIPMGQKPLLSSAAFHLSRGAYTARSAQMRLAEWIKCFLPSLFIFLDSLLVERILVWVFLSKKKNGCSS